jgi:hypothetical protein
MLAAVCAGMNPCPAGQPQQGSPLIRFSQDSLRDVEFRVCVSSNIVVAGATNTFRIRIENHSTNALLYDEQSVIAYLTNDLGTSCSLISPPERRVSPGGFNPSVPSIDFTPVDTGNFVEWDVPSLVESRLTPGSVKLVGLIGVVKSGTREGWILKFTGPVTIISK